VRTFVSVDLDVKRGEEKLAEVEKPRVDVSAISRERNPIIKPARKIDFVKRRRTS
jgi:hypothetical protein